MCCWQRACVRSFKKRRPTVAREKAAMSDHHSHVAIKPLARSLGVSLVAGVALSHAGPAASWTPETTTPIEHLVVIFQENVSFDHYFATYPVALNPAGEPL